MPIHPTAPPRYTAAPWDALGLSRSSWYKRGFAALFAEGGEMTAYQPAKNTPILYPAEQVGIIAHWLQTRAGLIALGELRADAPLLPDFGLIAWFDDGQNDADCPRCDGPAVAVSEFEQGRVWCPTCGVVEED